LRFKTKLAGAVSGTKIKVTTLFGQIKNKVGSLKNKRNNTGKRELMPKMQPKETPGRISLPKKKIQI